MAKISIRKYPSFFFFFVQKVEANNGALVVAAEMFEKGFAKSSMEDGLKEDEGGEQGQTAGGS